MSIELYVYRRDAQGNENPIGIDEWKRIVASDAELRLRTFPYLARNPKTGQEITIPVGEADAEFYINGDWLPFLCFIEGRLSASYHSEWEHPASKIRVKIADISEKLDAQIATDAGDEILRW